MDEEVLRRRLPTLRLPLPPTTGPLLLDVPDGADGGRITVSAVDAPGVPRATAAEVAHVQQLLDSAAASAHAAAADDGGERPMDADDAPTRADALPTPVADPQAAANRVTAMARGMHSNPALLDTVRQQHAQYRSLSPFFYVPVHVHHDLSVAGSKPRMAVYDKGYASEPDLRRFLAAFIGSASPGLARCVDLVDRVTAALWERRTNENEAAAVIMVSQKQPDGKVMAMVQPRFVPLVGEEN